MKLKLVNYGPSGPNDGEATIWKSNKSAGRRFGYACKPNGLVKVLWEMGWR